MASESGHSWRQSITSIALRNDEHEPVVEDGERSPTSLSDISSTHSASPFDSTTALVLEADDPDLFLSFDEEGGEGGGDTLVSSPVNLSTSLPAGLAALPLPVVLLFLVSPSLLLGATMLQDSVDEPGAGFAPRYLGVIWAGLAALLTCLANQIWVLSGQYVRKWRCVFSNRNSCPSCSLLRI